MTKESCHLSNFVEVYQTFLLSQYPVMLMSYYILFVEVHEISMYDCSQSEINNNLRLQSLLSDVMLSLNTAGLHLETK